MGSKHGNADVAAGEAAEEKDARPERGDDVTEEAGTRVSFIGDPDGETRAVSEAQSADGDARLGEAQRGEPSVTPGNGAVPPPPPPSPPPAGPGGPGAAPSAGAAQLVPVSAEQIALALGQAQQRPKAKKGPAFWVPVTILSVIAGLGLLAGAFFIGRSTRDSPDVVAGKVAAAKAATARVDLSRARDALDAQRIKLKASFRQTLRRQQRLSYKKGRREGEAAGYASGQSAGYASGQASGYSSGKAEGQAQGQAQGYQEGFDQGTCYTPGTLNYVC